jgi:hypothetical protein
VKRILLLLTVAAAMVAMTRLEAVAHFDLLEQPSPLYRRLITSRLAVRWHSLPRYGGCATSAGLPTNFGNAIQRVHIRDMDASILDFHGARLPQPPQGPGERLPVGPYQARELPVGEAGGYHAAAVGRLDALGSSPEPPYS